MQTISSVINKAKDGYLKATGWIADHPHQTLGYGSALAVVAFVALIF